MVAIHSDKAVPVALEDVAGKRRLVPADHPWLDSARRVGVSLGCD
jgi:6-phosphofructokinase 1